MKRPLLYIFVFLILGIIFAMNIENYIVLTLIFTTLVAVSIYFAKKFNMKICFALWFVSLFSFLSLKGHINYEIEPISKAISKGEAVVFYGSIKDIKKIEDEKIVSKVKVNKFKINSKEYEQNFNVISYLKGGNNLNVGDKIVFKGVPILPKTPTNPNEYNEYLNYKSNNILYKFYYPEYSKLEKRNELDYYINNLNLNISKIYDSILPKAESDILKAITLGEKDYLTQEQSTIYRNSGVYHIFAVSGLHVGVLAFFLLKFFKFLRIRHYKFITILVLILYCILTGSSLSTIRATIMCTVALISTMFNRESDFISAICFSAIILLIFNPFYLFNVGFLYSYIAVFSIAFLGQRFVQLYRLKGIVQAFVFSFFVSIAVKPITAYYFFNFTTLDIFLNIIFLPFMGIVVSISFLCVLIGSISIPLAQFFIGIVYYIIRFFTYMTKVVDNINFSNILIGRPSTLVILSFYAMLILIGYSVYETELLKKRKKYAALGMFIFISSVFISLISPRPLSVTMLDVGQGECIVGETENATFLVDCGSSSKSQVGKYVLLPYLRSKGISKIDFAFISHMELDHINGIFEIMEDIKIENIFVSSSFTENKNYNILMKLANEKGAKVFSLKKGDKLILDKNIEFEVIYPEDGYNPKKENNKSLVFMLKYKENKILFTGDIEKEAEKEILEVNEDISADILKVAHHGSKSSTIETFLYKVSPLVSIVSSGRGNLYGHPSKQTLDKLANSEIFRTDEDGAIILKFYKDKVKVETVSVS